VTDGTHICFVFPEQYELTEEAKVHDGLYRQQKKRTKNNRKYYLLVSISETEFDLCGVASEV